MIIGSLISMKLPMVLLAWKVRAWEDFVGVLIMISQVLCLLGSRCSFDSVSCFDCWSWVRLSGFWEDYFGVGWGSWVGGRS